MVEEKGMGKWVFSIIHGFNLRLGLYSRKYSKLCILQHVFHLSLQKFMLITKVRVAIYSKSLLKDLTLMMLPLHRSR